MNIVWLEKSFETSLKAVYCTLLKQKDNCRTICMIKKPFISAFSLFFLFLFLFFFHFYEHTVKYMEEHMLKECLFLSGWREGGSPTSVLCEFSVSPGF